MKILITGACGHIGSYFVENLTQNIEKKTFELIEKIDAMGGSIEAIKNKYQENEISTTAYKFQKDLESSKKIIVGINKFKKENEHIENIEKKDDSTTADQLQRLEKFKSNRNTNKVKKSLKDLKNIAIANNKNVMPYIINAIKSIKKAAPNDFL